MSKFDFTNRDGKQLAGRVELPDGPIKAFAIFAHCFTCSKNSKAATQVARRLAELGIAVLRFDFTGLGNSEGDFANSSFSSNVDDLIDAAEALENHYSAPSLLIGHSLGGAAVLLAAGRIESVVAVATIGAPSEPRHVEGLIGRSTTAAHDDGSLTIRLGGRDLSIGTHFVDDLKANRVSENLPKLGKALMIFHSPVDSIVSVDNARQLYQTARHPKSFVSIDGADHMLSDLRDSRFVADTLAAWATRYLLEEPEEREPASTKVGEIVVEEQAGFTQTITAGEHQLIADEPLNVGGGNKGPTPYDLLLASLGACTSMTLRMYARYKGLQLETIKIKLKHSRIHAEDCTNCETEKGKIDRIDKEIIVSGKLTPEQINRLGEIADRCPVHKTLTNEKRIETAIRASVDPSSQ